MHDCFKSLHVGGNIYWIVPKTKPSMLRNFDQFDFSNDWLRDFCYVVLLFVHEIAIAFLSRFTCSKFIDMNTKYQVFILPFTPQLS